MAKEGVVDLDDVEIGSEASPTPIVKRRRLEGRYLYCTAFLVFCLQAFATLLLLTLLLTLLLCCSCSRSLLATWAFAASVASEAHYGDVS